MNKDLRLELFIVKQSAVKDDCIKIIDANYALS